MFATRACPVKKVKILNFNLGDKMAKKIWAIYGGCDWFDASIEHLILPDGMNIKQEHENRQEQLCKYSKKEIDWPGSFAEFLINKGATIPTDDVLEEFWDD